MNEVMEIERKREAIRAGIFLATSNLFVNTPDVVQGAAYANTGTVSYLTYSTARPGGSIIGAAFGNIPAGTLILTSIPSEKFLLRRPIAISVTYDGEAEWIATFDEAEISRSGETMVEAIDWLESSLVELYELFSGEDRLGPLPKKQLQVLEQYFAKKQHRTR
jgi:hypothetical protein